MRGGMKKLDVLVFLGMMIICFIGQTQGKPPPVTAENLHDVASSLEMFVDELPMMPKLYGYSIRKGLPLPATLTIGMFEKKWKFHRDLPATTVFAYGITKDAATVPGPTIEALQGVPTTITWLNFLPGSHILPWDPSVPTAIPKTPGVPTVVHLHGGVHPPQSDGSALAWFTSRFSDTGPAWTTPTYTYPNVQHAGNLWYHDHALGLTRVNLLAGLVGAYVLRNPAVEVPLGLPSGDDSDHHLVLFDRSFSKDGSLYINYTGVAPSVHPQWQPEYFGDAIIVNGKAWPHLKVQRRKYRFRIINAGNARYYNLRLSNGLKFTHVGADSSYLPKTVTTTSLLLSPSEIADVIVDFSKSTTGQAMLTNDARYPYPSGTAVDSLSGKVMKFIILPGPAYPPDFSKIPASLVNYRVTATTEGVARTRYITMYEYQTADGRPTHLYINGKRFEDPVTETPTAGTTELWEVINLTGDNHPLHVHLASIQVIKVQKLVNASEFKSCMATYNDALKCNVSGHANGPLINVPDYERTWKNTVKIEPGYVTSVIVQFRMVEKNQSYPFDATAEPGYVYHCHILDHEDNAMIRPLKLVS